MTEKEFKNLKVGNRVVFNSDISIYIPKGSKGTVTDICGCIATVKFDNKNERWSCLKNFIDVLPEFKVGDIVVYEGLKLGGNITVLDPIVPFKSRGVVIKVDKDHNKSLVYFSVDAAIKVQKWISNDELSNMKVFEKCHMCGCILDNKNKATDIKFETGNSIQKLCTVCPECADKVREFTNSNIERPFISYNPHYDCVGIECPICGHTEWLRGIKYVTRYEGKCADCGTKIEYIKR